MKASKAESVQYPPPPSPATATYSLNPSDRCDASQSEAALVLLELKGRHLQFCANHFRRHAEKLTLAGWSVLVDVRSVLEEAEKKPRCEV